MPPPAASSLARLQSSVRGLHRFLAREGIESEDQRAVIERTMPPDMSTPLTRDELDAVSAWTLSGAP